MKSTGSMPWDVIALAAGLAVVMAVTDLGGQPLRSVFALDTAKILNGEVWRLATAHVVNLSRVHTYLNVLGLCLIYVTLWSVLTLGLLARAIAGSALAISLGWVLLMPPGPTYVGFSGITHGVMAFGGLWMLRVGPRWFALVILACLAVKLGHEIFVGAVPGADAAIGGRVSFISHALGSLGGALVATRAPMWPRAFCAGICLALAVAQADAERARQTVTQIATVTHHG